MASIYRSYNWRAVVIQDGDGPPHPIIWLTADQPDPTPAQLQNYASTYSISESKFGTPVLARVVQVMGPGPLAGLLTTDENAYIAGFNQDGTIGTIQTNLDPGT